MLPASASQYTHVVFNEEDPAHITFTSSGHNNQSLESRKRTLSSFSVADARAREERLTDFGRSNGSTMAAFVLYF